METFFTHVQNIYHMLREANIGSSTIETVIDKLPIPQSYKRVVSILNTGGIPNPKTDYHDDISNYFLIPYEIKPHRIYKN